MMQRETPADFLAGLDTPARLRLMKAMPSMVVALESLLHAIEAENTIEIAIAYVHAKNALTNATAGANNVKT